MPVISCGGMRYQFKWQDVPPREIPRKDQENLEACIHRALELGINHIETARGYGTSEMQLGNVLPKLPRDKIIVQTKVAPQATAKEFLKIFETSMKYLRLDHVDLLALHGINNQELLDWSLKKDGCLAAARRLQKEGRTRFVGFSTHATTDIILKAVNSGEFDYVNVHWYFVNDLNWAAIEAAHRLDLGVFIISPNDKGGNRATLNSADDMRDPFCIHPHDDAGACFQHDVSMDQYARLEEGVKDGWQPLLQRGLAPRGDGTDGPLFKVFLAAGSDAHGDLNFEASMDVTDFLGKPSRSLNGYAEDNALGKISTVVYAPAGMGARGENVLRALRDGRSVGSNGPLLIAGFDRNANGSLDDPGDIGIGQQISLPLKSLPPLQLSWVSSDEFGPVQSIKLMVGTRAGELPPVEVPVPAGKALASGGLVPVDLKAILKEGSPEWKYIRLEASSRNSANNEFRCYTNPIWIRATGE